MKFQVSGQQYEIDLTPERLMGDELLLIDTNLPEGWAERWATGELGVRDIIVITYLAASRVGDQRPFEEFVKTIAPLTFKIVDETAPKATPPRAKAKTAPLDGALGPMVRNRKAPKAAAAS